MKSTIAIINPSIAVETTVKMYSLLCFAKIIGYAVSMEAIVRCV